MISQLFKQSGIYFSGLIISKILSVVVFILFARILLPQKFGDFVLFITLLQIVTFLADFGLNQWYQKQADCIDKNKLFNQIISARIFTLFISLVISIVFLSLTSSFQLQTSILLILTLIPEAFLSVVDGYYLEKKQSLKVSLKVTSKMGFLLLAYWLLKNHFTFELAVQSYLISSFLTLIWFFPRKQLEKYFFDSFSTILKTLKSSSSYAFLIFSSFLYARGDSLVIRYTINSTALGIYGAAYRYLETLSLLPAAISQNLFPISAKKTGITLNQLIKITTVVTLSGIFISIALCLSSQWLITGILGNAYMPAIPILKIFSLVLFLFFINAPLSTVVQSSALINKFLPYGFLNTVVNIILNLLFVPFYGVTAAAWVMLSTEITGLIINLYFVNKLYRSTPYHTKIIVTT